MVKLNFEENLNKNSSNMTNTDNNKSKEEDVDTKNLIKSRELMYRLIIRFVPILT